MLEKISVKYRNTYESLRKKEGVFNGDYCFGNAFAWGGTFNTCVHCTDELYISCAEISENRLMISYPMGEGNKRELVEKIVACGKERGKTTVMGMLNETLKKRARELFPGEIRFERLRDSDDYIYKVEDLINLSGKALHTKKNMLNSFLKNDYVYEKISAENFEAFKSFCLENSFTETETAVMNRFFDNFYELELSGACLKIGGKIVAATVGERSGDTVIIHIEKADKDVRGAYAAINNLFLKNEMSDCEYVNREDDMGHENLRTAKLSYKPCRMEEKYIGIFI